MRERASGCTRNRIRQTDGSALRDHHAMRTGGQRRANNRAQIVWIFHAVEQHDQALLPFRLIGVRDDVFQRGRCARGNHGYDALMIARVGQAIELPAIFEAHRDAPAARQLHDFFHARVLPAFRNHDAVECTTRFQRFANGMNSRKSVHESKVYS